MSLTFAHWIVVVFEVYLLAGVLFAVPFVSRGVGKLDPRASGAGAGFRVLIFPGVVALWPLVLHRWLYRERR
jgi:hypothetical protein